MNGPSETATLPPLTSTTPIQSNGGLFPSYYHSHQQHHHNGNHFPLNGHYHLAYSSSKTETTTTMNNVNSATNDSYCKGSLQLSIDDEDVHVTVLKIDQKQQKQSKIHHQNGINSVTLKNSSYNQQQEQLNGFNSEFVTVLTIVSTGAALITPTSTVTTTKAATNMNDSIKNQNKQTIFIDNKRGEIEEEVIIYRLPGERLGMALRFDGGQSVNENIRHVFVQNITLNSPSSKAIGLMLGMLREGDEILQINGRLSSSLTRLECITLLRDAPVSIRLFVRRRNCTNVMSDNEMNKNLSHHQTSATTTTATTTTTMTTLSVPKVSNCCQMPINKPNNSQRLTSDHNDTHQNRFNNTTTLSMSSLSSSTSSLISPSNTPLLTQLLNSCSDQSITASTSIMNNHSNKKVPPPVPPRMATTTLSSKRKSRPMPIPPQLISNENSNENIVDQHNQNDNNDNLFNKKQNQSSEMTMINKQNSDSSNGIEQGHYSIPIKRHSNQNQLSAVVEKPPRRKNFHVNQNVINGHQEQHQNGHVNHTPPPLPPRRPKGPPPKPPIERIQSTPSIVSVVNMIQNGYQQHQQQHEINKKNSINLQSAPIIQNTTKSLPSLVNVNHCSSNTNSIAIDSDWNNNKNNHNKLINVGGQQKQYKSNDSIKTASSTSSTNNNIGKVTFNISNSKVSSFIRQTAEKIHRKLSGKTHSRSSSSLSSLSSSSSSSSSSSNGDSDEEKDVVHTNSDNDFIGQNNNNNNNTTLNSPTIIVDLTDSTIKNNEKIQGIKLNDAFLLNSDGNKFDDQINAEENREKMTSSMIPQSKITLSKTASITSTPTPPPTAASYSDFNQDIEESFESDTDDTSSSVSTIIERGSFNGNNKNNSIEQKQIQSNDDDLSDYNIDNISIVERVLSPFDKEFPINKSPIAINIGNSNDNTFNNLDMDLSAQSMIKNLATVINNVEKQEEKVQQHHQLSSDKTTNELINDDEQLMMMMKNEHDNNQAIKNDNGIRAEKSILIDADRSLSIDASPNSIANNNTDDFRRDHLQINGGVVVNNVDSNDDNSNRSKTVESINQENNRSENDNYPDNPIDDDDEDLNEMKNDLFSRLDDDKDDFMIDTDYLNESSSRYMFHHNGSELILNTYSELSSITEEDEEDDIGSSDLSNNEAFLSKQSQGQKPITTVAAENPIIEEIKPSCNNSNEIDGLNLDSNGRNDQNDGNQINDNLKMEFIYNNEMVKSQSSDCSSTSSSSTASDQTRVSLDNVFEFLNKANDDFEFVERMLELTNDKIDSIDDIMRIRESLRGLQESDKRENLQKFLDGKDVFEELIALSSSSNSSVSSSMFSSSSSQSSTPSSPDHEFAPSHHHHHHDDVNHDHNQDHSNINAKLRGNEKQSAIPTTSISPPTQNLIQAENSNDFVSLPVFLSDQSKLLSNGQTTAIPKQCEQPTQDAFNKSLNMINKLNLPIDSKIPTLFPINKPMLNKRSQSITNIFSRSNSTLSSSSFTSLIETKPSLIPRPISNFNLSLPQPTFNMNNSTKNNSQQRSINRTHSHNCLNRSTSMQSIFSTNSLSRSTKPATKFNGTMTTPRRPTSILSNSSNNLSSTGKNYHHNCLNHNDGLSLSSYGSLSRTASKSSTSVYNTGSLPRPISNSKQTAHGLNINRNNMNHSNNQSNEYSTAKHRDFRATSLTDLTNGLNNSQTTLRDSYVALKNKSPNQFNHYQQQQQQQTQFNLKSFDRNHHHQFLSLSSFSTTNINNSNNNTNSNKQSFNNNNNSYLNDNKKVDSVILNSSRFDSMNQNNDNLISNNHYQLNTRNRNDNFSDCIALESSKLSSTKFVGDKESKYNNNTNILWQPSAIPCFYNQNDQTKQILKNSLTRQQQQQQLQPKSILRNSNKSNYCNKEKVPNSSKHINILQSSAASIHNINAKTRINSIGSNSSLLSSSLTLSSSSYSSSSSSSSSQQSDSESSDIITSSDGLDFHSISQNNNDSDLEKSQQHHHQQAHRVCFMDQINPQLLSKQEQEHFILNGNLQTRTITMLAASKQEQEHHKQKLTTDNEMDSSTINNENNNERQHLHSISPEDVNVPLSSSASASSISSLGSENNFKNNHKKLSSKTSNKSVSFENDNQHRLLSSEHSLPKSSFFLAPNPHREDSGIFASDDNTSSTSEFSQSPSPELLTDRPINQKILESVDSKNRKCSENFMIDNNETDKMAAANNNINGQQMSLSRSSSAPCESEVIVSTLKTTKSIQEYETESLLSRDSFITARRQQNVCKLKGLIIPKDDNVTSDEQNDTIQNGFNIEDSNNDCNKNQDSIDLPTIVSEEIIKMENLDQNCNNNGDKIRITNNQASIDENIEPIEIIPLKSTNVNIPKYSPMFKRRTFSLPAHNHLNNDNDHDDNDNKKIEYNSNNNNNALKMQPKPRLSRTTKINRMNCLPPLPPTHNKSNKNNNNDHNNHDSIDDCDNKKSIDEYKHQKIMNEFVIYQKQHSMRAIIFDLNDCNFNDEKEYLLHLGFKIKGGFDSDTDTVTVESIDPNGLAAKDGRLQVGDRIISINGKRLAGMTHNKIIDLLKTSCLSEKVVLVCTRPHEMNKINDDGVPSSSSSSVSIVSNNDDNNNSNNESYKPNEMSNNVMNPNNYKMIRADITKDITGLGFMIQGGKNSTFGDLPISIKKIYRGGAIDREGTLIEGDELLFVNNHPIEKMTKAEAWNFLKQLPDGIVSMVVRRKK